MKAVIIAGGRGERLRPLTDSQPKPMIEVDGKPILKHTFELFKKNGINDFILALCYLPDKIISYFGDGSDYGIKINYIFESANKPLGTAGSIEKAKKLIKEAFIVTSGDILRDLDIKAMIACHKKNKAFATLNVYKRYGPDPKSLVLFDKKKRVAKFIERPKKESLTEEFVWANGSFYIFEPEIFDFIPKNRSSDFGQDVFPKLLQMKKRISAYQSNSYFVDIGNLKKLEEARKKI